MGLRIVQICSATCGYYIVVGIDETCFLFFHWPQISHACGLGDLADADLVEFFGGFCDFVSSSFHGIDKCGHFVLITYDISLTEMHGLWLTDMALNSLSSFSSTSELTLLPRFGNRRMTLLTSMKGRLL